MELSKKKKMNLSILSAIMDNAQYTGDGYFYVLT